MSETTIVDPRRALDERLSGEPVAERVTDSTTLELVAALLLAARTRAERRGSA